MAVLIVLFGAWLVLRGIGALGVGALATWQHSACYALALMFVFTGIAHFNRLKHDLARMVPAVFPWPMLLIYLTGVLEFMGAVGLLLPRFRSLAGICLIALLIVMFPANVKAAVKKTTLAGKPATPLWLRAPMQVLFIGLCGGVLAVSARACCPRNTGNIEMSAVQVELAETAGPSTALASLRSGRMTISIRSNLRDRTLARQ